MQHAIYESVYKTRHPVIQGLNQAVEIARYQEKPIQGLSHDARLKDLPDRLKTALAELDYIRNAIFNTYADDKAAAQGRCMPELVKLCARRLLKIPTEIGRKEKEFELAQQLHDDKAKNLREIGYSSEQVEKFLKDDVEAPCKEKHKAELSVLRKELGALNAFTRDYPRYDQRLLIGTHRLKTGNRTMPVILIKRRRRWHSRGIGNGLKSRLRAVFLYLNSAMGAVRTIDYLRLIISKAILVGRKILSDGDLLVTQKEKA